MNFGKKSASVSLGKRGRSLTVGPRGVYGNVGFPGSGLSYRARLDKGAGLAGLVILFFLELGKAVFSRFKSKKAGENPEKRPLEET